MIAFQRHSMRYQWNSYQKGGFQIQTLFSVVTVFYLWGDRLTEIQYNFMTTLPQGSVVALTLRPWPITAVGSEPLSWMRKCVTDLKRDIYVFSFSSALSVLLLPLFRLPAASWMLSETQSMSVTVCVILCNQPSPNTPPQTHISHFGMMTLPVPAFFDYVNETV